MGQCRAMACLGKEKDDNFSKCCDKGKKRKKALSLLGDRNGQNACFEEVDL